MFGWKKRSPQASTTGGNDRAVAGMPEETTGGAAAASTANARKLMVRDVAVSELQDGRPVLLCLASSPGLASEVRCRSFSSIDVQKMFFVRVFLCVCVYFPDSIMQRKKQKKKQGDSR